MCVYMCVWGGGGGGGGGAGMCMCVWCSVCVSGLAPVGQEFKPFLVVFFLSFFFIL